MAGRRRDLWRLVDAYSLPEAARGGPEVDLPQPDPVLAWVQFADRLLEVEGRVLAYTERAVLVEWGHGQGADAAWVWRDAVRPRAASPI
ncbi:hypothetical protein [Curtobacterium sp. MCBA15_004]|uniref:hypothetical protein n=1 Tax=Curtobacterium sp. MCBA15_004 TaxID=1898733 RepID=UPI0008DD9609|nr:hypothetical protein [Curtobacterium sp. MCBA15_004]WIA96396.1 hypothetical protein QOL16_15060 [Curtobacterium sp. MCBA15_004]